MGAIGAMVEIAAISTKIKPYFLEKSWHVGNYYMGKSIPDDVLVDAIRVCSVSKGYVESWESGLWNAPSDILKLIVQYTESYIENVVVVQGQHTGLYTCSEDNKEIGELSVSPIFYNYYRTGSASVRIGNYVYILGGQDHGKTINNMERYDLVSKTWKVMAPLSVARNFFAAVEYGGLIYAIGGGGRQENYVDSIESLKSCEVYDPAQGTWSPLPDMKYSRRMHCVTSHRGRIYVTGGIPREMERTCECFDIQRGTWSRIADMPMDLRECARSYKSMVINDSVYVVKHEYTCTGSSYFNVFKYEVKENVWKIERWAAPYCYCYTGWELTPTEKGDIILSIAKWCGKSYRYNTSTKTWIDLPEWGVFW